MRRILLSLIAVAAVGSGAQAGSPGPPRATVEKFAYSEVVVRAKVTAVAADPVTAPWHYDAQTKAAYRVATVTIETAFAGAEKRKEIRVAFEPPVEPDPKAKPPRRVPDRPQLKEGQEVLLFLCQHPRADFYVLPEMNPPVEIKGERGKVELETAKRFAAVLADPLKALKSEKAETRAEAAAFLVIKYCASGEFVSGVDEVAIPAEESRLIFAALLEAEWKTRARPFGWTDDPSPHPLTAFQHLHLTEKEGWVEPVIVAAPVGQPQPDYGLVMKDAFAKWRAGAGKDYVLKKLVPKK